MIPEAIYMAVFQSHFGLILSMIMLWEYNYRTQLSIPFWSDFIGQVERRKRPHRNLSIPFWSDFILDEGTGTVAHDYSFQSHFGLILSLHDIEKLEIYYSNFQSHFGLILSRILRN